MPLFRRKGTPSAGAAVPAPCQVRSETGSPCPRRAAAEIRGVAFCGPCAREQEAYFAIGELVARGEERGHRGKPLAQALERLRRERAGGTEGAAAETQHGPSGAYEAKCSALKASRPQQTVSAATPPRRGRDDRQVALLLPEPQSMGKVER